MPHIYSSPPHLIPRPRIRSIVPRPRIIAPIPLPQPQRHLRLLPLQRRLHLPIRPSLRRFIVRPLLRSGGRRFLVVGVCADGGFGLAEILPFAPAVEVDQGLHAAPFHDFAGEPFEVDGLGVRVSLVVEKEG